MKRVHILVEGQTEETFTKELLVPYLLGVDIFITPIILTTRINVAGPNYKGGVNSYQQVRKETLRLLGDTSVAAVTTMLDYYGLPNDFPGKTTMIVGSCFERVAYLEDSFRADIGHPSFMPYIALHEFEALLFSSPSIMAAAFPKANLEQELQKIRDSYNSPEEINDGSTTHPAARIKSLIPEYQKRLYGPLIASRIGLDEIRSVCSHFDEWLTSLESL
jgi:hypothetical protein